MVTLLRWGRVYKDASRIIPFPGTRMDRHLLHVEAHCGEVVIASYKFYIFQKQFSVFITLYSFVKWAVLCKESFSMIVYSFSSSSGYYLM